MTSAISILQAACVRIGAEPLTSLDDGSTEATVASHTYGQMVEALLSEYPWRFATKTFTLNQLTATAPEPWSYLYQLPTDLIHVQAVKLSGSDIRFMRIGSTIACDYDANGVTLHYTWRVPEEQWPPYFTMLVTLKMSAVFASSVAEKVSLYENFENMAEVQRRQARSSDAQGQSPRRMPSGKLMTVRY